MRSRLNVASMRTSTWLVVVGLAVCGCGRGREDRDTDSQPVPDPPGRTTLLPTPGGDETSPSDAGDRPTVGPDGHDPAPEPSAAGEAWSSQRNGPLKQGIASTTLPETLERLWKMEIPFGVPATPAIVDGRVFVPTLQGFLYCLDLRTGDEVWKYRSIDDPDPKKFAPGFKAAPTVTEETVYTGDEDGLVHAIDRETGTRRWTFDTRGEVAGGPTIVGENGESLIVGSHGGGLFRLKTADGDVEWTVGEIGPINLSPPVVEGRTFALGCETGALVSVDVETGVELSRLPLENTTLATPAVWGEHLYLGMYDGRVLAIDYKKGETTWAFTPKRKLEFHGSCAVTEDSVYAAGRDKLLHRLNRANGEEVWSFAAGAQNNASPVVAGDRVFFASDDKHLYAVSVETGEERFSFNLEETPSSGPAIGEGCVVIGTEGNPGAVFCFGAK